MFKATRISCPRPVPLSARRLIYRMAPDMSCSSAVVSSKPQHSWPCLPGHGAGTQGPQLGVRLTDLLAPPPFLHRQDLDGPATSATHLRKTREGRLSSTCSHVLDFLLLNRDALFKMRVFDGTPITCQLRLEAWHPDATAMRQPPLRRVETGLE